MSPFIFLDLSRLLSRVGRPVASGIDRVEMAYARHLLAAAPERSAFAAMNPWGRIALLPPELAGPFVELLDDAWQHGGDGAALAAAARRVSRHLFWRGELELEARIAALGRPAVYLVVSHQNLDRRRAFARLKRRTGARLVFLVHDLIPIEYPQFSRRGQPRRHGRRLETVARLGDGVIVNSQATRASFERFRDGFGAAPVLVAPLGIEPHLLAPPEPEPHDTPYFAFVATIEPKKNHLLLLDVWRRLEAEFGERAPRLVLVGERGWMVSHVMRAIRRQSASGNLIVERDAVSDARMARIVAGARASLFPSLAEGFGLPVAESLALGVPALCSDLPALREVGGDVPEYLDPADPAAWRQAILDYARLDSPRRQRQVERLERWRPPLWDGHFSAVEDFIAGIAGAA
jgi:glycosyltransferase involved in cell wall biosynthesis